MGTLWRGGGEGKGWKEVGSEGVREGGREGMDTHTFFFGVIENSLLQASEFSLGLAALTAPHSNTPSMGENSGTFSPGDNTSEDAVGFVLLAPPIPLEMIGEECEECL